MKNAQSKQNCDTSAVYELGMLDEEYQASFNPNMPWLFETEEFGITQYDTEDAACEAQRNYRFEHGFDPFTGVKL